VAEEGDEGADPGELVRRQTDHGNAGPHGRYVSGMLFGPPGAFLKAAGQLQEWAAATDKVG